MLGARLAMVRKVMMNNDAIKKAEAEIAALEALIEVILDHTPEASVMMAVDQMGRMAYRLCKHRIKDWPQSPANLRMVRDYLAIAFDFEARK